MHTTRGVEQRGTIGFCELARVVTAQPAHGDQHRVLREHFEPIARREWQRATSHVSRIARIVDPAAKLLASLDEADVVQGSMKRDHVAAFAWAAAHAAKAATLDVDAQAVASTVKGA